MGFLQKEKHKIKNPLLLFIAMAAVGIVFVSQWIMPLPKFGGDWHYVFPEFISERLQVPQIWDHSENLGNNYASRTPLVLLDFIQAGINKLTGLDFTYLEVIVWFIPFLIGAFLFSYKLSKKFFASKLAATITALFYTLNSYVLVLFGEAGHINILVAYALSPLVILKLVDLLDKQSFKQVLTFSLSLSLVFLFDIRIGFVVGLMILIVTGVRLISDHNNKNRLNIIKLIALSATAFLLLNLYWLVPIVLTPQSQLLGISQNQSEWIKRLSFQEVSHGLFMEHPFWSAEGVNYFIANEVSPLFYILFVIILIGIFLSKPQHKKRIIILLTIWLIGIFFLKGSNPPLGDIYIWLFDNIPGFNMFREPQKFYVLVVLPFALLLGFSVSNIEQKIRESQIKYKLLAQSLVSLLVFSIIIISITPVFTTTFTGPLKARELPEYAKFIHELTKQDIEFYRTLWIPQVTSSAFRSNTHPRIDANLSFNEVLGYEEFNVYEANRFVASENFDYLVDKQSVKYIVFPNDPEILRWYKSGIENISDSLANKKQKYKLVKEDSYLVFENLDYDEWIYAGNDLIVTNDNLRNHQVNLGSYSPKAEIAILDQNQTLNSKITGQSKYVINISKQEQITGTEDELITSTESFRHSELFQLEDRDLNRYFNLSFERNSIGRYNIKLSPVKENLVISDQKFELRSTNFSSSSGILVKDGTNYLVSVAGQQEKFNSNEIKQGKVKGPFYIEDLSLKYVEVYQQNPELYLNEKFDERNTNLDVGDCNNFDGSSLADNGIGYGSTKDSKKGRALILRANKHIACFTKALFTGANDDIGVLYISYKHTSGSYPEICLFDNVKQECILTKTFADASEEAWTTKMLTFAVPEDPTRLNIYLYANASEVPTTNLFDEVISEGYFLLDRVPVVQSQIESESDAQIFMRAIDHTIQYQTEIIKRLKIGNPSFEAPINYQSQAKDCNNIDKTELADNEIEVTQTNDAVDKRSSLKVSGMGHSACFNLEIGELNPNFLYNISFYSKSGPDSYTKYCILNIDTKICELQDTIDAHGNWQQNLINFRPSQKSNYEIYFSSFSAIGGDNYYHSFFDDVKVFSYPINYESRFILNSIGNIAQLSKPNVEYEMVNPTTIILTIKNATTPYYLFYGTKFDPAWQLKEYNDYGYLANYKGTDFNSIHFQSSSYKNAWMIEKTGNYKLVLSYTPQLTNIITLSVSAMVFVFSILSLLIVKLASLLKIKA